MKESNNLVNKNENTDSIILFKKNSISRIKFSSIEYKNKYLFGKIKKNNTDFLHNYFNEKKTKTIYSLKNFLERIKIKDISKLNKIIYNIEEKDNLSIFPDNKNKSFSEYINKTEKGKRLFSVVNLKIK